MFNQILKSQEWRPHICFRPVEKDALIRGSQDIPWIEIQVSQRVRDVPLCPCGQRILDLPCEFPHFFFAQDRRRGLALLLHELRHHVHERIHQSQKGSGPKIPASSPKELVSLSQRGDLKLRQCLRSPLPGTSISNLIQCRTRKLCRQPSVPGGMSRDYVGHKAREESRQGDGHWKLPPVGFTHGLKPQGWAV